MQYNYVAYNYAQSVCNGAAVLLEGEMVQEITLSDSALQPDCQPSLNYAV